MSNDYDNLPIGIKVLKLAAGLCPPLATWLLTGSIWYAAGVFLTGLMLGNLISGQYTAYAFRGARRDESGNIHPDDMQHALKQSLPVFLWASPICGAVLAAAIVWATKF